MTERERMRVGVITTLSTNIGDDLIRTGITRVLAEAFPDREIEYRLVNKHDPFSAYHAWHPIRWIRRVPRYGHGLATRLARLLHRFGGTVFDSADLIVQSGAPVLWPDCHRAEWADPLWHQVAGRLHGTIPVIGLASGACYPVERVPAAIDTDADRDFVRRAVSYCRLFTARDALAAALVAELGLDAPLIPCTALLHAADDAIPPAPPAEGRPLVLVNYMEGGGHYDWAQDVDARAWERTVRELIRRLETRYRVAFLCHTPAEAALAERLRPDLERRLPRTPEEFVRDTRDAVTAVCNRMHASVGMAGLGIPSVAIGTDTRLAMVEQVGLPARYVKEATADVLARDVEDLIARRDEQRTRLLELRRETMDTYVRAIRDALA